MDKKGFTTIELIMSFSIISILLVGLMAFVMTYRNRVSNEELRNNMLDLKNTITKVVYDDIVSDKYVNIAACVASNTCAVFKDKDNVSHELKVVNKNSEQYFNYDGLSYLIPEHVLIRDFEIRNNELLSHLKIVMHHEILNDDYEILININ